jgi:precorrin-2 dehydrogenase / sirohydrochlorin ferrochelatase
VAWHEGLKAIKHERVPLASLVYPRMPKYLPICLNLEGRPVVVVGGGGVGTQKVHDFLDSGARVTVVSPVVSDYIRQQVEAGEITLHKRRAQPGDIAGAFLVVVATDDPETNAAVYAEANAAGQLVNVCDDPPHCNYIFASKIERGPLTVSIFTHGTAPAFSRRVRREMEAWLGPEYGELAELLAEVRPAVKAMQGLTQPQRQRIFERLVYSELLLLFREGKRQEARNLAQRLIEEERARL